MRRGVHLRYGLIAIVALLAGACETAPEPRAPVWVPPQFSDEIITPAWAERAPTARDILRFYPAAALSEGVEGVAVLACNVLDTRALACVEDEETPPGLGFGPAAVRVSQLFVVRKDYPGVAPGVAVRLPVRFKVE